MATTNRNINIDLVRAIAIVVVVAFHSLVPSTDSLGDAFFNLTTTVFVVVFFFCSGALIFPIDSGRKFVSKRLKALLPPFIIWSAAYLWLNVCVDGETVVPTARRMLWFMFTPMRGFLWFVPAIIGLYLVAPFVSRWLTTARRSSIEWFLMLCLIGGLTPFVAAQTIVPDNGASTFAGPFFNFISALVGGYYLTKFPIPGQSRRRKTLFVICAIVTVALTIKLMFTAWRWGYVDAIYNPLAANVTILAATVFAIVMMLPTPRGAFGRIVTSVSKCSYGIYLCHIAVCQYLLPSLPFDLTPWLSVAATLIISYLATLSYRTAIHTIARIIKA